MEFSPVHDEFFVRYVHIRTIALACANQEYAGPRVAVTGQLTRWRYIVGFSGTDTGGRRRWSTGTGTQNSRTDIPPRAGGGGARASAGVFGPAVWQAPGHRPAGRALSRIRDPRRLSEEIRRGADRALGVDHRVLDGCPGEAVQLRHIVAVWQIVAVRLRHSCCSARAVRT